MKTLIATAILFSSTCAFAHDTNFSSDSCDVDLNAGLRINQNLIEFSKNDEALYQIIDNETLIVNGQEISLNSSQQQLVTDYSSRIREVVPEVKELAVDAIDLAVDGVNLAFNELLGEGNDLGEELTAQLHEIRDEVDIRFGSDKEFYISENGNLEGDFFGEEFEQRIEGIVEETIQNSIGSLLIAVGQEMLFSGGDIDSFETKMENFGQQIEHEMESRGKELEHKGEALCQSILAIDKLEEQLTNEIDALSGYNVITASYSESHKI